MSRLARHHRGRVASRCKRCEIHDRGNPNIAASQQTTARFVAICLAYKMEEMPCICLHINRVFLSLFNAVAPQIQKKTVIRRLPSGELAGARTQDPNIKSVVLYLLSYEFIAPNHFWWCKDRTFFSNAKIKLTFFIHIIILYFLQLN